MIDPSKIWSSSQLPTLPSVAVKLLQVARDPEADLKSVVEIIKTDPAISAKVLKSANSSFFGLATRVTSVDRAVPLLGTTVVTSLALSFSLAESAMTQGPIAEHFTNYWRQSVVQAAAAESLCRHVPGGLECEYFLAGLLMDIGRLAMLKTVSRDYLPVLVRANAEQRELHEVESEVLGINHVEIGAQLMGHWKLPESLIEASRFQHAPAESLRELMLQQSPEFPLSVALAVASSVGDYFCAANKGLALQRMQTMTRGLLQLDEADREDLLSRVRERVDACADLFAVQMDELGDPGDLMAAANEQLAQLALREHVASTQAVAQQKKVEQEKKELESKHEQLQREALHDGLTEVYNRRFFEEALAKEVHRCSRYALPLGIIFLDIDHFKQLNDTYGHPFGDAVLKRIAAALSEVLRQSDTLARYGGEEFVVLASQPTEKGLQKVAERIRSRIESERIYCEEEWVPVTVSIGASVLIPGRQDPEAGARLVAAADAAMYESKQRGRNQVHFHSLLNASERHLLQQITQSRFSRWLVARGVLDIPAVSRALVQVRATPEAIGQTALRLGLLDPRQVDQVLQSMERTGHRFGETAVELGFLPEGQLVNLLVLQQEDPLRLALALKKLKLLPVERLGGLLQDYLAEFQIPATLTTPPAPQAACAQLTGSTV